MQLNAVRYIQDCFSYCWFSLSSSVCQFSVVVCLVGLVQSNIVLTVGASGHSVSLVSVTHILDTLNRVDSVSLILGAKASSSVLDLLG